MKSCCVIVKMKAINHYIPERLVVYQALNNSNTTLDTVHVCSSFL